MECSNQIVNKDYQDSLIVDQCPSQKRLKLEFTTLETPCTAQPELVLWKEHIPDTDSSSAVNPSQPHGKSNNEVMRIGVVEIEDSPPRPATASGMEIQRDKKDMLSCKETKQEPEGDDDAGTKMDSIADGQNDASVPSETGCLMGEKFDGSSSFSLAGEGKEATTELNFSPDEHLSVNNLMSTQINRQIERVEKFLKTDRLRRRKETVKYPIN